MKKYFILVLFVFALSSCSQEAATAQNTPAQTVTGIATTPVPTATATLAPTPTATQVPLVSGGVSPLQGVEISELRLVTSNPFKFKYPYVEASGSDYNHTGIDLAFFKFKDFTTVLGHPIEAVLPGKVVEALTDRWPYGNMILIETPLNRLSPEYLAALALPAPYSETEISAHSSCLPDPTRIAWSQTETSLYIVYAHMESPSSFKAGDEVNAGDVIGAVGHSGNAIVGAEHLHLEVRLGPSDAQFGTISDYKPDSTEEERYNYCIWALSEVFQPIDPTTLWSTQGAAGQ
ncbi:MAG: M23 family metallopeptidase [Anaerolineaceae bacterium]|nr:M23 family metallopeptidase [Anaerolineaceae bacterium]